MKKRADLQGIRGLAIISVLLFHFYPNVFPNGYLGVDQYCHQSILITLSPTYRFFVLSGFLMCMLLEREQDSRFSQLILTFYSKRFKRILPLYLLSVCLSIVALYQFYPENSIEMNKRSASKALIFVSNVATEEDKENDYFQRVRVLITID